MSISKLFTTALYIGFSWSLMAQVPISPVLQVNDGQISIGIQQPCFQPGDTVHFTITDQKGNLPDGALVQVEWLDEKGRLLESKLLSLKAGKACQYFDNKKIKKGPSLIRAYFSENGQPKHFSRQLIFIQNENTLPFVTLPDSLYPYTINAPIKKVDMGFTRYFLIREKFPHTNVQYQRIEEDSVVTELDQAERINDSLVRITNQHFVGPANYRFYVNNAYDYKSYDEFQFTPLYKNGMVMWAGDPLSENLMQFALQQLQGKAAAGNKKRNPETITAYTKEGLPDVTVNTLRKTPAQQLEDKYSSNAYFRQLFGQTVVVTDDVQNNPNMSVLDYLAIKFPIIQQVNGQLRYRNGAVGIFVDELPNPLPENLRDIALIKFIKGPIRGLNEGGGGLQNSRAGLTGMQGTLVFYIRKGDEWSPNPKVKQVSLSIQGIDNQPCQDLPHNVPQ